MRYRITVTLVSILAAGLLAGLSWCRTDPGELPPDHWKVEDLVGHLQKKGLEVRTVPAYAHGPPTAGAYLTTTDLPWRQLNRLPSCPEHIDDWQGTVYCSPASSRWSGDDRLWQWGECGERFGPFVLFGDPGLRARIRETLRDPP
jgi:hypothetical protein